MPKYFEDKVFNHYLYFTSHCIVEAMHVHAGNEELSEEASAKFFVRADGSSVMKRTKKRWWRRMLKRMREKAEGSGPDSRKVRIKAA